MSSWRPEGWENPFKNKDFNGYNFYEAGADAILEALIKAGLRMPCKPVEVENFYVVPSDKICWGTWVWIPDDKEVEK